jgi:hypothetical protein
MISNASRLSAVIVSLVAFLSASNAHALYYLSTTGTTAAGYVTAWPTGSSRPNASNINFVAAQTIPNLVIAKVGSGGKISLFNSAGSTDLIVDAVGWLPAVQ